MTDQPIDLTPEEFDEARGTVMEQFVRELGEQPSEGMASGWMYQRCFYLQAILNRANTEIERLKAGKEQS